MNGVSPCGVRGGRLPAPRTCPGGVPVAAHVRTSFLSGDESYSVGAHARAVGLVPPTQREQQARGAAPAFPTAPHVPPCQSSSPWQKVYETKEVETATAEGRAARAGPQGHGMSAGGTRPPGPPAAARAGPLPLDSTAVHAWCVWSGAPGFALRCPRTHGGLKAPPPHRLQHPRASFKFICHQEDPVAQEARVDRETWARAGLICPGGPGIGPRTSRHWWPSRMGAARRGEENTHGVSVARP